MFHPLAYDEACRTYLARFSGTLTDQDLADFAIAAKALRQQHGLVAGLQDYLDVETLAITTTQTIARGSRPPIMTGQKRAVVTDGVIFGMFRMFATYQEAKGDLPPAVVRTLAEAYDLLGLTGRDFNPVPFGTVQRMAEPTTTPKEYAAAVAAARKAGGNEQQSHWRDRLTAVMKRRGKVAKKTPGR